MKCEKCGYFTEEEECPACREVERLAAQALNERVKTMMMRLGGKKAFCNFNLANYDNKAAIKSCDGYPEINIFLWGAAGTGKTHLATALVREHDGLVVKPQHIYRECRGLADGAEEQEAINRYINAPHLVIDDLGQDKRTDWSFSTLYEIIDGRDMAGNAGLIVTSNLSLGELAERLGDDRLTSRLAGMCRVVELTGKDRRMDNGKTDTIIKGATV